MRLAALALILLAADAASAQRPNTVNMTCAEARGLLAEYGALVMSTGGHTFDRFVVDRRFCEFDERVEPASAPTLDTSSCPLGYTCEIGTPFWSD